MMRTSLVVAAALGVIGPTITVERLPAQEGRSEVKIMAAALRLVRPKLPEGPIRIDFAMMPQENPAPQELEGPLARDLGAVRMTAEALRESSCNGGRCTFDGFILSMSTPEIEDDRAVVSVHAAHPDSEGRMAWLTWEIEVRRKSGMGWKASKILNFVTSN